MACGCFKMLSGLLKDNNQPASSNPSKPAAPPNPPANGAPQPPPPQPNPPTNGPSGTPPTLTLTLVNRSTSPVFASISGLALDNSNALFLLSADGQTPYYPTNPPSTTSPLATSVAIPLAPGSSTDVTIPHLAGGRIWFSLNTPLNFLLNPGPNGPALVEPSVTNPADPSINLEWAFAEFTYNSDQLFANISYVDFVSLPISLDLEDTDGTVQSVAGLPPDGLARIAAGLTAQHGVDGAGWDTLIAPGPNGALRVLSPNAASVGGGGIRAGYWDGYIDSIWAKYATEPLRINTQAASGTVAGTVTNDLLTFLGEKAVSFAKPAGADVFSCSTGPFSTSGAGPLALGVIPRLAAAFNRSTLGGGAVQPDGVGPEEYYKDGVTNHYSRVVHEVSLGGRGYAFPYDDVVPDGGTDVAGTVFSGRPKGLVVGVGGN